MRQCEYKEDQETIEAIRDTLTHAGLNVWLEYLVELQNNSVYGVVIRAERDVRWKYMFKYVPVNKAPIELVYKHFQDISNQYPYSFYIQRDSWYSTILRTLESFDDLLSIGNLRRLENLND